jgi:hypothetical protein
MSEPIQDEIHSLLQEAEAGTDAVKELALDCLKQFRKECGIVLEWYQKDVAHELLETGAVNYDERARERDQRLEEARNRLRERLGKLLRTAEEKHL